MSELDAALLDWAVAAVAPRADVVEVRGLRDDGSPWVFRLRDRAGERAVVLRVGDPDDVTSLRTEMRGLRLAFDGGVPVPRLLAADLTAERLDAPVVLVEALAGTSAIPKDCTTARLRRLGAAAAALHAVPVPHEVDLPWRSRPIAGVDFAALRREQPMSALLATAEEALAATDEHAGESADESAREPAGLVHGDLWQGNTVWDGETLSGLVDWDCAGRGPAGVDLGSLRLDAAMCHGPDAPDEVLLGWQDAAGRAADNVAYWDVTAALSTPPDMGWFTAAIAGQGRPDLDQELLLHRRDAFLSAALTRLEQRRGSRRA